MSDDADASGAPEPGTVIAEKYRVLGGLGGGGMGCLVTAEHLLMKKSVAIKFLRGGDSAQARARMFREARAAQALSSENVVRVFDLGIHAGDPLGAPSVFRTTAMFCARFASSTTRPPQTAVMISSRVSTCPACSTSTSRVSTAFRVMWTGSPFLNRTFATGSRLNSPNL